MERLSAVGLQITVLADKEFAALLAPIDLEALFFAEGANKFLLQLFKMQIVALGTRESVFIRLVCEVLDHSAFAHLAAASVHRRVIFLHSNDFAIFAIALRVEEHLNVLHLVKRYDCGRIQVVVCFELAQVVQLLERVVEFLALKFISLLFLKQI